MSKQLITTAFLVGILTSAFSFSDELISPPRGPVPSVESEIVDKTYIPIWDGTEVDEKSETPLPTWLPDALSAMPNPETEVQGSLKAPPGHVIAFDKNGKQHLLQVAFDPNMGEGTGGTDYYGLNGEDIYGENRTFSNLVFSNNPSAFPASTACRVLTTVTDVNGTQWSLVGSAYMVDARTAVTAGHVVYVRTFVDSNGITRTVNDWVDTLQIFPGSHLGVDNWGGANMVDLEAWTGWTNNGDWDWDVGLIRVDRAVGMLSGWTGWWYGGDCQSSTDRTYYNNSFPAEACGANDAGGNPLHNGQDMYFYTGQFDSCLDDNQLQINTAVGCFTAVWGGMSGSGYYFFDDDNDRRVHAITSTSDRATWGRAAKIFEGVHNELTDNFIPQSRGADFDLQPLHFRDSGGAPEPVSFNAGDFVSGTAFTAANPTNGTGSGTWSFNIYLSTNDNISASDMLLAERVFDWNFEEMSQINVNNGSYQLPLGTPSSTYWIGAILDDATDGDSDNNDTDTWDAMQVLVQAVSDPEADSVDPIDSEVFDGDSLDMDIQVSNNGSQAVTFQIEVRASTDQNITGYDYLLGIVPSGWLGALDTWSFNWNEEITDSLPDGEYYLGLMIVNTSGDVDLTNNTVASDTTFTKLSRPENDDCIGALAIGLGDYPFSTVYATTDGEAHPECDIGDGGVTGNDIWYGYQCFQDGILTVSTCNQADYDTDLVVYQGFCGSNVLVGCNDDGTECSGYSSHLEVDVYSGNLYMIRVGGWEEGHVGDGILSLTFETGIVGDFNNDGQVGVEDILILIAAWGSDGSDGTDLNGDGTVDIADLLILIANWS